MRKKLEILKTEIKNILVIRPDALGDLVLTLPAIETLKNEFPAANITVLAKPYTAPLLKRHPAVARTIFDYDLRKYNFDLSVNYFNDPKETWATYQAKIPYRLGDSSRLPFGWLNNLKVFRRWNDQTRHEVEFNLDLLAPLNLAAPIEKAGLKVDEGLAESLFKKFHLSSHYLLIGCHLGAGGTNNKSWDIQEYAKTINSLAERPNTRILLLGGPDANDRAREIQKHLAYPTINTVGALTISEFIALASKLNLYLGTDTGPTHLAAALNVPMVVLFLSKRAKPLRWGPWGTRHLVIRNFSQ